MQVLEHFKQHFADADRLFCDTADAAGLSVTSHPHPLAGPQGEAIATRSVLLGNPQASQLVVLISGTHGVETLCGSACQSLFLQDKSSQRLFSDTAVLMIHGLNCWGAAHLRRNNEDNVDLSRNFLDFSAPLPDNPNYRAIQPAISCKHYRGEERDTANNLLKAYAREHGLHPYVAALMGGQYEHAAGFAYGGSKPVWSHQLLKSLLAPFADTATDVRVVEYHSGLGPYAYGTAATMQTGQELALVREVYGGWVEAPNELDGRGQEPFFQPKGHPTEGFRAAFPNATLRAVVLEFGTYPPTESLPVLLDDHWLTHFGEVQSPTGQKIKSQLLEMHYPADPEWRRSVAERSAQVIRQTLVGLK